MHILDNLRDDRLAALLDYAEYLLSKQAAEDGQDVADSLEALKNGESVPWNEVRRQVEAVVQN